MSRTGQACQYKPVDTTVCSFKSLRQDYVPFGGVTPVGRDAAPVLGQFGGAGKALFQGGARSKSDCDLPATVCKTRQMVLCYKTLASETRQLPAYLALRRSFDVVSSGSLAS